MVSKKHLIIGAGIAGLNALEEIRRITSEDEVKLVNADASEGSCNTRLKRTLAENS